MTSINRITFTASLAGLVALGGLVWSADPADAAQRMCGKRDKIAEILNRKFEEAPLGLGVGGSGKSVYEVYTSKKGTWTMTMTLTSGMSCIMAAGHSWQADDPKRHLPQT